MVEEKQSKIERAKVKFPYLYKVAEKLGFPPPTTEAEVEQIAEAAKSAPFAVLAAAAAEVDKEWLAKFKELWGE